MSFYDNLTHLGRDKEINEIKNYFINSLEKIKFNSVSVFGSAVYYGVCANKYSDIDIVACTPSLTRSNSEVLLEIIREVGGDFIDKMPIYYEDTISPRIEYFYRVNDLAFDINIFPESLWGVNRMKTDVIHDSVDIIIGAMNENAVSLVGEKTYQSTYREKFSPFYADELRYDRLEILKDRIIRSMKNYEMDNKNIDTVNIGKVYKIRKFLIKWLFIYERKYPFSVDDYIEYQLKYFLNLPQIEVDRMLRINTPSHVDSFFSLTKKYLSK